MHAFIFKSRTVTMTKVVVMFYLCILFAQLQVDNVSSQTLKRHSCLKVAFILIWDCFKTLEHIRFFRDILDFCSKGFGKHGHI